MDPTSYLKWQEAFYKGEDDRIISASLVARCLSRQPRFCGQSPVLYTVAQHSMFVSNLLYNADYASNIMLLGLLHDVSEAFLCDIPRPIKQQLPDYLKLESEFQEVITRKLAPQLRYSSEDMRIVKEYDDLAVWWEAYILFNDLSICDRSSLVINLCERAWTITPTVDCAEHDFLLEYHRLLQMLADEKELYKEKYNIEDLSAA